MFEWLVMGLGRSDKRKSENRNMNGPSELGERRVFLCLLLMPTKRSFTTQEAVNWQGGLEDLYFKERITNSHPSHCLRDEPFKTESTVEETKSRH